MHGQDRPVAHTPNAKGQWHDWEAHARGTAALARAFAEPFGAGELAWWLGLWHDLGKLDPAWQAYVWTVWRRLVPPKTGPDHAVAGAWLAERFSTIGALAIAGHHQGLPSPANYQQQPRGEAPHQEVVAAARQLVPDIQPATLPLPPDWAATGAGADLYGRMLFSALVDADSLDVQAHFHTGPRSIGTPAAWELDAPRGLGAPSHGQAAIPAAQGLHRLRLPAGVSDGAGLLGMALRHVRTHRLSRVIFTLAPGQPTTPLAATLRTAIDDSHGQLVLEQHTSAYERPSDPDATSLATARRAAQNWDAPIIVTTQEVLAASLFSNLPAAMRKLHRLARSLLIVDDRHPLPAGLRQSVLDVLGQLCAHFGATVILTSHHWTTATPARHLSCGNGERADRLQTLRARLDYPGVAARSNRLLDATVEVTVVHGPPDRQAVMLAAISELTDSRGPLDSAIRALQPFLVSIRRDDAERLAEQGLIRWLIPGIGQWLVGHRPTQRQSVTGCSGGPQTAP